MSTPSAHREHMTSPAGLTVAQVTARTGASERTVRRWIATGRVTAVRVKGRVYVTEQSMAEIEANPGLLRVHTPWMVVFHGRPVDPAYMAEVEADVTRTRAAQGLPPGVEDPVAVAKARSLLGLPPARSA